MGTNVNYLDVSSSLDLIEVIDFNEIIYVGELYTLRSLNVSRYCGVNTNHRLCYLSIDYTCAMFSKNGIIYPGSLILGLIGSTSRCLLYSFFLFIYYIYIYASTILICMLYSTVYISSCRSDPMTLQILDDERRSK